jgi:hypothetical protein
MEQEGRGLSRPSRSQQIRRILDLLLHNELDVWLLDEVEHDP